MAFIWEPSIEVIEKANVTRLSQAHGIRSYDELVRRSVEDIEWFWAAAIDDLGLEFTKSYERVLDTSRGIQWARWFDTGEINIAHNCVDRHSGTAIIWEGEEGCVRRLNYAQLQDQVGRFAGALRKLDIHKGDAVGLFMPMTPEAVIAFMGCAKAGAIVVPIFSGFGAPAITARLNDAGAKALVCSDGFFRRGSIVNMKATADEALLSSPDVRSMIVARRANNEISMKSGRDHWWDDALAGATETHTEPTSSEDPVMIAYTSGTTGKPKGAVHVHGGLLVKLAAEVAYQTDYQPGEILFWLSDMGWIMGPWQVIGTLALGGTLFLYDGAPDFPGPGRLWEMISRHRVSIAGVSPTLVRALMRHGPPAHDLSSLRVLGGTGEPWNDEPYRWFFNEVGKARCPIINFSGGTEVGACFLSACVAMPLKVCSLGGPSLGMAVDVYDQGGKPVRGEVGELVCTKPWPGMTRGIWGDADRYLNSYWGRWPDVWVHGDWARIDRDGQWFLQGRSDDTMNVAGKRIGPAEVESVLVGHPSVAEAAVVGVPDAVKGESIWCFVVSSGEPSEELRAELSAHVSSALGKAFKPGAVKFVDELPKTRNAKVLRRAVRAAALGSDPGDLSSLENPSSLEAIAAAK